MVVFKENPINSKKEATQGASLPQISKIVLHKEFFFLICYLNINVVAWIATVGGFVSKLKADIFFMRKNSKFKWLNMSLHVYEKAYFYYMFMKNSFSSRWCLFLHSA